MRKLLLLTLCSLLLIGCSQTPDTNIAENFSTATSVEEINESVSMEIMIYYGNDQADGFESQNFKVNYFNSHTLIEKLIEVGTLNDSIELQSEEFQGTCLHLDFNNAFRDLICSMGTSGEYIVIGSVVNTFLDNYSNEIDSVYITVNGDVLESGHVIYDFELTRHE